MKSSSEKSPATLAEEVRVFFREGAHDIQNLFQVMNLWLRTAHEGDKDQAARSLKELREHYTAEIDRLRSSFDDFLSIRTAPVSATQINVSDVVATVLDELHPLLSKPGISIEKELSAEAVLFYPEPHLKSAVHALMDNALRYRKPDEALVIRLSAHRVGEDVTFSVRDNGIGIDMPRYHDQLFAPFTRYTDQSEGQGIRLHLVKMMVEKYGGEVTLTSQPGEGTTVTLYLANQ